MKRLLTILVVLLLVAVPAGLAWWRTRPARLLEQAEHAIGVRDLDDAEAILTRYLDAEPADPRGHLLLAQVRRRLKRPTEAEAALRQALRLGLADHAVRRESALLQASRSLTPATERNLLAALNDDPRDVEVLEALARGYAQERRDEEAEKLFSRWLELEPSNVEARLGRGQARRMLAYEPGRRLADAISDFQEVLKLDAQRFEARLNLAECYLSDARLAEARAEFLRCVALRDDRPEPLVGLAHCAIEAQDWPEAEKLLDLALKVDPQSLRALILKGDVELRHEHYESAVEHYRRALKRHEGDAGVHLKLAQALQASGKDSEAREHEQIYRRLKEAADKKPER
jgi:cytochrome c-type biogenesis protein CcmH/NrfG